MLVARLWRIIKIYARYFLLAWIASALLVGGALLSLGGAQRTTVVMSMVNVRSHYVGMDGYALGGADLAVAFAARYSDLAMSDVFLQEAAKEVPGARLPIVTARPVGTTIEIVVTDPDSGHARAFADALVSLIQLHGEGEGPTIADGPRLLAVEPVGPVAVKVKEPSLFTAAVATLGVGFVAAGALTYLRHLLRRAVIDARDVASVIESDRAMGDVRVVDLRGTGAVSLPDRLLLDPAVVPGVRIGLIVEDDRVAGEIREILAGADDKLLWCDMGVSTSARGLVADGSAPLDEDDHQAVCVTRIPSNDLALATDGPGRVDLFWVVSRAGIDLASDVCARARVLSALDKPVRMVVV